MRALEAAIHEFIAAHNAQSAPFIWTKTADEILASIARFAQRTVRLQQAPGLLSRNHWDRTLVCCPGNYTSQYAPPCR